MAKAAQEIAGDIMVALLSRAPEGVIAGLIGNQAKVGEIFKSIAKAVDESYTAK